MAGISGSGPLGAEAHIAWFGQPAQESAFPAVSDSGPGQCSGSGATSFGALFRGLERTSCTSSGASREGAIMCVGVNGRTVDRWMNGGKLGHDRDHVYKAEKSPISGGDGSLAKVGRR